MFGANDLYVRLPISVNYVAIIILVAMNGNGFLYKLGLRLLA